MTYVNESEYSIARQAVDFAKTSFTKAAETNPQAKVAIVIALHGKVLGWAAKGIGGEVLRNEVMERFENESRLHAEELLLKNLGAIDLSEAVAYVTLEPCTTKSKGTPCAHLLVQSGIKTVFIGNADPHPQISNASWKIFHDAGVMVRDFPVDLRNETRRDNIAFMRKFVYSPEETGGASFNYSRGISSRVLGPEGKQFKTSWTPYSKEGIYALDYENHVCIAKNIFSFKDIEDPSRWFEDSDYNKRVLVGQIVIFRNDFGYALIKIKSVTPLDEPGNGTLNFEYELRYLPDTNCVDEE